MNWALFVSTFSLIFLAELGDKTQLAVMSQSASAGSRWTVFFAAVLALAVSTAVGVLAGDLLRRYVPDERIVKGAGGLLFLLFGGLMLREALRPRMADGAEGEGETAEVAAAPEPKGWLGRFVLQQAAAFERMAFEDYARMAAEAVDPAEKAVFLKLAEEERWHHQAMAGAVFGQEERDIPITEEMAEALPPLEDLMQRTSGPLPEAVARAIRYERATAAFYRTLAEKSKIPRLSETLRMLAVAEENHARRLEAMVEVRSQRSEVRGER